MDNNTTHSGINVPMNIYMLCIIGYLYIKIDEMALSPILGDLVDCCCSTSK